MNDLSLNDLAGCNNRLCQAGCDWSEKGASPLPPPPGSLNDPVPTGVPSIPPAGASMQQLPAGTGFSATARTLFGSRPALVASGSSLVGSTAPPDGFRRLAQARKQAADSLPASTTFYPALNAQKEADLNPLASGYRKRKKKNTDPRSALSASHDRNVKPKIAKQRPCVLIWIPFTKDINRGRCYIPAAHILVVLAEAGYLSEFGFSPQEQMARNQLRLMYSTNGIHGSVNQDPQGIQKVYRGSQEHQGAGKRHEAGSVFKLV
ncbi:hypothetical protein DFH09DRAFT_1481155 [Mycena vulgaris]|nr:hypothetical protein DFH09DRAFT_1481155 [Mycena vulgaris]